MNVDSNSKSNNDSSSNERLGVNKSEIDFLSYQIAVAREAIVRLDEAARKLDKRKGGSDKRIHNMRVAFRRFYSVWNVLSREGFKSKKFKKKFASPLKTAYKLLGVVRDWDVNLNTARELGVAPTILAKWQLERDRLAQETMAGWSRLKFRRTIKKLDKFIKKRGAKLRRNPNGQSRYNARTRDAIEVYLVETEMKTKALCQFARSFEELHALRLSIKAWRYILVEFFGCSCEPLVEAQQLLGQINDLERVRILLQEEDGYVVGETIEILVGKQRALLDSLDRAKLALPFGLRPVSDSLSN